MHLVNGYTVFVENIHPIMRGIPQGSIIVLLLAICLSSSAVYQ